MSSSPTNSMVPKRNPIIFFVLEAVFILGASYGLLVAFGGPKLGKDNDNPMAGLPGMGSSREARSTVIPVKPHWPSFDAMLAEAPKVELEPQEFEVEKIKYTISVPKGAKIEAPKYSTRVKVTLNPATVLQFDIAAFNLEERKKADLYFLSSPKLIPFSDKNTLLVEFDGAEPERYKVFFNGVVGQQIGFVTDQPEGAKNKQNSLENCLLAMKIAQSLKLKEPDPKKLVEIFDKYSVRYDTGDGDKITRIAFPMESTPPLLALAAQCPDVESLTIYSTSLRPGSLEMLSKFSNLKSLNFEGGISDTEYLKKILACQKLEKLFCSVGVKSPSALDGIDNLTGLTALDLGGDIPTELVPAVPKLGKLTKLQQLHVGCISHEGNFKPGDWDFLSNLKDLKSLKMYFHLPDAALLNISKLPGIEQLELERVAATDAGLASFANLKNLTNLKISGSLLGDAKDVSKNRSSINGSGLAKLAGLDKLTALEFEDLQLNDDALKALKQFPALTSLKIENTQITDAGLSEIQSLKNLKTLRLRDNKKVTEAGLKKLKEALPKTSEY